MKVFFSAFKIILYTLIFLGIFNSTYGRTVKFNQDAKSISNYFSGFISFDNFDYAGSSGGFIDKYCFPFSRGRIFSTIEEDHGQYDESCQNFWASGTAFLTRREIYNKIATRIISANSTIPKPSISLKNSIIRC